jgi:hypothetical protein
VLVRAERETVRVGGKDRGRWQGQGCEAESKRRGWVDREEAARVAQTSQTKADDEGEGGQARQRAGVRADSETTSRRQGRVLR